MKEENSLPQEVCTTGWCHLSCWVYSLASC